MERLQELEFDTIHILDGVVSAIVHLPELHTVRIRPHTRFLGDLLSILPPLQTVELITDTDTLASEGFFDWTSIAVLLGSLLERSVTTLRDISLSSATWRALALHYRKSIPGPWSRVERLALIDDSAQVTAFAARTFPGVRVLTGTFSIVPFLQRWNTWPQLRVLTLVHPNPDDDLWDAPDDVVTRAFPPHICLDMLATPPLEYHDHHAVIARTLQLCRTDTIRTLHISNTTADALGVLFDHDTLATCPSLRFLAVDFTAEAYYPWYTFHDLSESLSGLQQLCFLSLWCKSYGSIILETYRHSALDMLSDLFYGKRVGSVDVLLLTTAAFAWWITPHAARFLGSRRLAADDSYNLTIIMNYEAVIALQA
ncbi:hypothetical protein EXIGLDRAFT_760703 [Exidia glandulosa HHB12029]|uniref:Uncharacterized protein n=1 Tax=Exidia glandulosa HHB12029 TaxID=1314781 RepID=A0A165P0Z1_EXIGL|nr:hypothetical protein EXIGLDRAFT_760703 [Exidia glandulosa HHB12029]